KRLKPLIAHGRLSSLLNPSGSTGINPKALSAFSESARLSQSKNPCHWESLRGTTTGSTSYYTRRSHSSYTDAWSFDSSEMSARGGASLTRLRVNPHNVYGAT